MSLTMHLESIISGYFVCDHTRQEKSILCFDVHFLNDVIQQQF